ncbi:hypothetical protein [Agrobacterium tumefaciens]|uniref:hypothetical protein n=1 Tax=Agrobacterium tumefaciens TaxID=358 RepID=UPI001571968A|nr:hypothetical protein [Agrobacterium tumefaciens]
MTADLQVDAGQTISDRSGMDTIIHAGFESEDFAVERDMTVGELVDIVVKRRQFSTRNGSCGDTRSDLEFWQLCRDWLAGMVCQTRL